MDRDRIKIIEFNTGDDGVTQTARPVSPTGDAMRVVEFNSGAEQSRQVVARPEDVGKIRIVEFDNDAAGDGRHTTTPVATRVTPPAPGQMKIVDFSDDSETRKPDTTARKGMKIIEFD